MSFVSLSENKYKYNGKEKQTAHNLGWYDYGARFYDPQVGRFSTVDPSADEVGQEVASTYCYVENNPISRNDPDGRIWSNVVGCIVGAAVEYGSQVAANRFEGKKWSDALTDIDGFDVAVSAGEGFITNGTSVLKNAASKAAATVVAEIVRNTVDVKKNEVKVHSPGSVIRNTTVGLTTAGVSKSIPAPNIKIIPEISPKQAVKTARESAVVNRASRVNIQKNATYKLNEAKVINKTLCSTTANAVIGSGSEIMKRKLDKVYGD